MLTSEEVRSSYVKLAEPFGFDKYFENSTRFPPALCRSLVLGEAPGDVESWDVNFGKVTPQHKKIRLHLGEVDVLWGYGLHPLISQLPLDGHKGLTDEADRWLAEIGEALLLLEDIAPRIVHKFFEWTTQIVLLESDGNAGTNKLTSSTFPQYPHCTFITDKSLLHIPPLTISSKATIYFLAENLYHEALHQELSSMLIFGDCIRDDYDCTQTPRINVPWRGQTWEPDRVIHAAYVYMHLIPIRRAALRLQVPGWELVESSLVSASEALAYLVHKFPDCAKILKPDGLGLLSELREKADSVVRDSRVI